MTTMQELQARLRETEGIVEAGLDIDEAELLVARYVDAVAAAAGAAQARSGGAGDTADEEIEEVVKVGYIYIFFHVPDPAFPMVFIKIINHVVYVVQVAR